MINCNEYWKRYSPFWKITPVQMTDSERKDGKENLDRLFLELHRKLWIERPRLKNKETE